MEWNVEGVARVLAAERIDRAAGIVYHQAPAHEDAWLEGVACDPGAVPDTPLDPMPGFPFLLPAAGALISGPTGGGKSSLAQAGAFDAARGGVTVAYLGHEVTVEEFNARAGKLASGRGIEPTPITPLRYLDLSETVTKAWADPERWVAGIANRYQQVIVDPLSAVGAALGLNFDQSNTDYTSFYDRLVQPLINRGLSVVLLDNIGHGEDARGRAKGVSAKGDKCDLEFTCKLGANGDGLVIRAKKVRPSRAPFKRNDEWRFTKDSQRFEAAHGADLSGGDKPGAWRPTVVMKRVATTLAYASEPMSRNAIRDATTGGTRFIDSALRFLETEGYVRSDRSGWSLVKPYGEEPTGTLSVPTTGTSGTHQDTGGTHTGTQAPANEGPTRTPHLQGGVRVPSQTIDPDAELERLRTKWPEDFGGDR